MNVSGLVRYCTSMLPVAVLGQTLNTLVILFVAVGPRASKCIGVVPDSVLGLVVNADNLVSDVLVLSG